MKALIYEGNKSLKYQDTADPVWSDNDSDNVRIKIDAVSICGSDMHAFLGHDERRPPPIILGHEAAGTIMDGADKGKRVAINPLVTCGHCDACLSGRTNICANRQIISMPPRGGAFADMVVMPTCNLVEIPANITSSVATLCEPIACGWHGVALLQAVCHQPLEKTTCLVIGGGAIGLGSALALSHQGVKMVTIYEPNPLRYNYIAGHYDYHVINDMGAISHNDFDVIIDAYGAGTSRADACAFVKPGGVIIHTGLANNEPGFDARRATLQEITFIGTYTYTAQDYRDTAAAIFSGALGELPWIEERHLSDGQQAFDDILHGRVSKPKITLIP